VGVEVHSRFALWVPQRQECETSRAVSRLHPPHWAENLDLRDYRDVAHVAFTLTLYLDLVFSDVHSGDTLISSLFPPS
jgi:hypothetical protein